MCSLPYLLLLFITLITKMRVSFIISFGLHIIAPLRVIRCEINQISFYINSIVFMGFNSKIYL